MKSGGWCFHRVRLPVGTKGILPTADPGCAENLPPAKQKCFPHAVQVLLAMVSRQATFADTVLITIRNHYSGVKPRGASAH